MNLCLLIVALSVIAPTALYPAYTDFRARRWAQKVPRDEAGIRAGAQSFAVGEGEVALLMIHGFASSPAVFQRMAPALAERGYRCRVMRLPGFGETPEATRFDLAAWQAAVDEEVRALRTTSREVWLVGHSMGGTLALDEVLRGGSVDGVVLVTPLIAVADTRSVWLPPRRWFELGQQLWSEKTLIETAFPVDMHEPVPGLDEMRDLYLPVAAYREMFAAVDRVTGQAQAVRCPVLMAVATEDLVVDSAAAVKYFSAIGAEQKKLVQLKASGHVAPLDGEWRELVAQVDQFVRK